MRKMRHVDSINTIPAAGGQRFGSKFSAATVLAPTKEFSAATLLMRLS
jgi:hypothetical protein